MRRRSHYTAGGWYYHGPRRYRNSGSGYAITGFVFFLLVVLVVCLTASCSAQSTPRWRILVERDTMAIGPLNDVRKWAGLRMAKNEMARQCAWELTQRNRELQALYAERDACWDALNASKVLMDKMRANEEALNDRANKWQRKAKRRKPWLFFGLGAATLYVVQQQMK